MDIPDLPIADLEAIAVRLDRCAERIEVHAVQTRLGTSHTWQGAAAERHRERVAGHGADLHALAERIRVAAVRVRLLATTACERVTLLGTVDVGTGRWP